MHAQRHDSYFDSDLPNRTGETDWTRCCLNPSAPTWTFLLSPLSLALFPCTPSSLACRRGNVGATSFSISPDCLGSQKQQSEDYQSRGLKLHTDARTFRCSPCGFTGGEISRELFARANSHASESAVPFPYLGIISLPEEGRNSGLMKTRSDEREKFRRDDVRAPIAPAGKVTVTRIAVKLDGFIARARFASPRSCVETRARARAMAMDSDVYFWRNVKWHKKYFFKRQRERERKRVCACACSRAHVCVAGCPAKVESRRGERKRSENRFFLHPSAAAPRYLSTARERENVYRIVIANVSARSTCTCGRRYFLRAREG